MQDAGFTTPSKDLTLKCGVIIEIFKSQRPNI